MSKIIYDGHVFNRNDNGYYIWHHYIGNYKGEMIRLHRYIWEKYNGPIPKNHIIHHIDFNKENNSIENLQCMTHSEHDIIHRGNNKFALGYKHTPEALKKIGIASIGRKHNLGLKRTKKVRQKMSESAKIGWIKRRLQKKMLKET